MWVAARVLTGGRTPPLSLPLDKLAEAEQRVISFMERDTIVQGLRDTQIVDIGEQHVRAFQEYERYLAHNTYPTENSQEGWARAQDSIANEIRQGF